MVGSAAVLCVALGSSKSEVATNPTFHECGYGYLTIPNITDANDICSKSTNRDRKSRPHSHQEASATWWSWNDPTVNIEDMMDKPIGLPESRYPPDDGQFSV